MKTVENGLKLTVPDNVFYNPLMAPDRWLSARLFSSLLPKGASILDLLCASGARGLQYAAAGFKVHLNDASPAAVKAAKANAKKNRLSASFSCEEANRFIHSCKQRFGAVDVDPFGSPSSFLQHVFRVIERNGIIALTATDLGALEGAFPDACFKRYGLISCETSFAPETGVRNLIAAAWLAGARFGWGVRPMFGYARRHYIRVFLQATYNTRPDSIGWISYCKKCENRQASAWSELPTQKCKCGFAFSFNGPTWTGQLGDPKLSFSLYEQTGEPMLQIFAQECSISQPYYDLHALARAYGREAPKTQHVINKLLAGGFKAAQTVFSGTGVRTDASLKELIAALRR
ncbi:methyltransferase domain-containing protein [archaeon]|nr:methyltransferase domain-containing protein [archaeon]